MQNILLVLHLIFASLLVLVVLIQKSEGGGLGLGGGNSVMSARGAANALTKATWILAAGFISTSIILTIHAASLGKAKSIFDAPPPAKASGDAPSAPPVTGPAT